MQRVLGALKATYNFFSGDPIILSIVAVAFVVAYALESWLAPGIRQLVAGLVFILLILLSIYLTLLRERRGRPRQS
jgi:hypothetical protein